MIVRDTYAWASPYGNSDPRKLYSSHFRDLYERQLWSAAEFRELLASRPEWPEIMLLSNFSPDRGALVELCRERGINVTHSEDGFFPHYETQHVDPLGFCWESSLPQTVFRHCSDGQRQRAAMAREAWLRRPERELPPGVRKPFVLWPLQLLGDQVNKHDLHLRDWAPLLRDFRARLPAEFQLVLKTHPRAAAVDHAGLDVLVHELPNLLLVPRGADLTTLLRECHAVAGSNSGVLYEARLMHHKPAYAYGRSWFTGHGELFVPLPRPPDFAGAPSLPHLDWLEKPARLRTERLDDYTDWFLAQLLARQIDPGPFTEPRQYKDAVWRLSYHAYLAHGEAIFDP